MSGTLADLMDDGVDDTAQEQIDAAAAAAAADVDADGGDEAAGEMDVEGGEEAAAEGEGEDAGDDEGEAGFDISTADPKLVKQIQKAVRSVMKKLDTNASYKKSILPQLKDVLGKKIVKHNKSLVKEIARQVVQEISNRMENGGAADEPDEPEEEEDAGKDDDDDDYDEKRSKKKKQKKRLRKANESDDDEEDPSSKRPSKKSKKETAASAKKGAGASASTLALLALPLPKSAFALYSERERDGVAAAHPTADKTEIVRTLQDQWSELGAEAKAEFEAAAEKDRASYEAELTKLKESNPAMYKAHMLAEAKKKRKHDIGDEEDYDDDPDEDDHGDGEEGEGKHKETKELSYIESIISDLKPKRKNKSELSEDDQRLLREAFLARMEKAVELDEKSSAAGKPAIARLNMLSDVQTQISKPTVAKFLVDEGLLRIINAWLAPEADGSLPNIKLRTTLYQLLETLPVEETNLSNSHGLGKRIMKLWNDPDETLANKKLLEAMLQKWMRPMLGLTTNYAKLSEIDEMRAQSIRERKSLMDRQRAAVQMRSNRVRMPEPAHFDYATRPQADVDREEEEEEARDAANAKRNEPLSRKQVLKKRIDQMGRGSANAKPKFKVDITGRASAI